MITVQLIGAGNVASHLFKFFYKSDKINLIQWYNRDKNKIDKYKEQVEVTNNIEDLKPADICIISVSDDSVKELTEQLKDQYKLVAHTSGSLTVYDIDKKHKRGVFYPLQTFSKNVPLAIDAIPFCIETLHKTELPLLVELTNAIGGTYHKTNGDQRNAFHLAAVFANNFTNQIYRIAHEITESHSAEFDILKPLIKETARKLDDVSPYMAQTGPAKRNDKKTLRKQEKALENEHHKEIYKLLTNSIKKTHGFR